MTRAGKKSLFPGGERALRSLPAHQRTLLNRLDQNLLLSIFDTSGQLKFPPDMDDETRKALQAFDQATRVKGEKEQ